MSVFDIKIPGKASRTLVDIARLASHSTCILEAEPGQVNTKDAKLVFYLSVYPLFHSTN